MTKKEKALLGISIVSAGAAGYLLYKYNLDTSKLKTDPKSIEKLKEHIQFKNLFEKRLKDFNELKRLRYIEQQYAKKTYYIMREETAVFTPVTTECIRYQC